MVPSCLTLPPPPPPKRLQCARIPKIKPSDSVNDANVLATYVPKCFLFTISLLCKMGQPTLQAVSLSRRSGHVAIFNLLGTFQIFVLVSTCSKEELY